MKLITFLILLAFLASCNNNKNTDKPKPNVILIMTDDQGYGDLGYHGNPYIRTPEIDKLASSSIRFTNFYVCPVCAPTRSSIMTGRYNLKTGIYDTYNGGATMATEEITIAEILRDNGYKTGIFGKWHLGDNYPFRPQDQGFTKTLIHPSGGMGQVGDVYNYFEFDSSYFNPVLFEDGKPVEKKGYCSDVFTNGAINFIHKNKDNPFFVYLSFNAPHTPLQLPEEYYNEYKDLVFDTSRYKIKGYPIQGMNEFHKESARKVYGMVSNIDDNLKHLFSELKELGIYKNSLIIFLTDNGPQQIRYTGGLRGRKGMVYEGGIRVPFFIHFPFEFSVNEKIEIPAAHIDILPTILDICNINPPDINLDGKSLLPAIKGEEPTWKDRPLFFHWQRGMPEPYRNIAVRKGDYKLVGHEPADANPEDFELFNIRKDPFEQNNIVENNLSKALELKNDFDTYYKKVIHSPNLKPLRAVIGSPEEDPVILNRNDAEGPPGIWAQDKLYAFWDISVVKEGNYSISFIFQNTLPGEGNLVMKAGPVQRTISITDTSKKTITMDNVYLVKGDFIFESWFQYKTEQILPFYIEIKRKSAVSSHQSAM